METSLHIHVIEREGSIDLKVEGDVDIATAHLLDEQIERAESSDAATIVVDLDAVGFIDSSGLQVLLKRAAASAQNGQRLRLTKGSKQAQRLFELTGLLDRLPFVES